MKYFIYFSYQPNEPALFLLLSLFIDEKTDLVI